MHETFPSIIAVDQLRQLAKLARSAPSGNFAEVGVYRGGSAYWLYAIALAQGRELHLFDTFEGTPYHTAGLDKHEVDREFAAEATPAYIRNLMPEAHLHIGVYPDTHPTAELEKLAFVHCDCDQYLSYKAVIEHMWPLVVPEGFLLFDDYPYLAGAKRAVEEHFAPEELRLAGSRFYAIKGAS